MIIISTIVRIEFLQYIVASATEKDPIVPCVLYRQEARIDSGKAIFRNNRLVETSCLTSVQLTLTQRVSAELMNKCCLGAFSQGILSAHGGSWKPKCVGLDELQLKLHVIMLASAESLWWPLWHRASHRLIYSDVWLEHYAVTLSTSKEAREGENLMCVSGQGWIVSGLKIYLHAV